MSDYVIGVDPDSDKHGVAVYFKGELKELHMLPRIDLVAMARDLGAYVSIENVLANNFVYARNANSKAIQSNIALKVGRCQQAQTELMRDLDHLGIKYELHKPTKANWAKNKAQFEKATGWAQRSNEDTRSAAYFGFIARK